ncbi:uncharacterized protein K452DRAFT_8074 [Aplosporella prunicola CBS 121167]|uniref:Uncharacterized protein n=1 Tax=Aplosporella prunicola CBS 121167 TaxID=1176127 RepID=A0A6A6BX56_9PEZI|nr:uncharacterized protein K452DRAFT_8074 [Aplosporella prunicola CBS 121167]KAF2147487.1 hypothetical protein K452DRAFT_8074 [Aplosporella prunicola CBS 121167]
MEGCSHVPAPAGSTRGNLARSNCSVYVPRDRDERLRSREICVAFFFFLVDGEILVRWEVDSCAWWTSTRMLISGLFLCWYQPFVCLLCI